VCESSEAGSCAVALARERAERARARRYVILSSDIAGEHRFASAVAQRLSQLGALTQGDRHASSAADALAPFNLQNTCARTPARARAAARLRPLHGGPGARPACLPGHGRAASHLQHLCVFTSAGVP